MPGSTRLVGLVVTALAGALLGGRASAHPPDPAYVPELLARAEALRLAQSPRWRALLHYRDRWPRGTRSEADAPDFFLAPNGATDPGAELAATLRAFAAPAGTTVRDGQHPQCAFVARYRWLREVLAFDPARLAEQPCGRFAEWRAALHPAAVTLVFPEAYMNNPSSMFGHTLLRLDAEAAGQRRDLLAYAVNFAAETGRDGAVVFAVKGVLGYYPGFFSLQPYYEKVKQYADWEQRDLWEYELDLTPVEIERLLEHLWELRGVPFAYYFFDENCSYQILSLLEAARPELDLARHFRAWAIPADTVRAVKHGAGLVRRVSFRPSATTSVRHLAASLAPAPRRLALAVARGAVAPTAPAVAALPEAERAAVLTLAHDHLRHAYLSSDLARDPAAARTREILVARSQVPVQGVPAPPLVPPAVRPDEGHRTARAGAAAGWRGDRPFVEIDLRPAYHDLLDPQGGYTRGAHIDFFHATLRLYADDPALRLHDLALVDIVSLAPRDELFSPLSWRIDTRVGSLLTPERHADSGVQSLGDAYVWRTSGGAGLTYAGPWNTLGYGLATGTLDVGGGLQDHVALGPGLEAGLFAGTPGDRWRAHLFGALTAFVASERRTASRFGLAQRIALTPRLAVRIEVTRPLDFGESWVEGRAIAQAYF